MHLPSVLLASNSLRFLKESVFPHNIELYGPKTLVAQSYRPCIAMGALPAFRFWGLALNLQNPGCPLALRPLFHCSTLWCKLQRGA